MGTGDHAAVGQVGVLRTVPPRWFSWERWRCEGEVMLDVSYLIPTSYAIAFEEYDAVCYGGRTT